MPRSIPVPVRKSIQIRSHKGQDVTTIAHALGLSVRTVRHLVQRLQTQNCAGMLPGYERCGRPTLREPPPLVREALQMRQEHARWGAGLIRVLLGKQHPNVSLPSERTLQRWLRRTQHAPAPPGRRPTAAAQRACVPHEAWQMDAADQVSLQTGTKVS